MGIMKSLLIVVAAAAVIILGLCIYLYNRRLDKIAKGEARGTHTSVPEPKMTALIVYLTFIFLIVWLTLINSQRITSQSENYLDDIMDMKAEISDLRREIEENATHFRRISFVTRNADFKEKMVDIVYTIELKEYSDDTKVTVNIDGKDVALEKMNYILTKDPNYTEALNYLAYSWAEDNENLNKALEYINRALEKEPKNPYYLDTLGWVKFKKKQYKEALDLLLQALNLADDDVVIFEHIGDVYLADGNKDLAKKYYKQGIKKDNDKLSKDDVLSIKRMKEKLEDLE